MHLYDALALPERGSLSLVGAGGKSSLMIRLSRALSQTGKTVVATTTTRIARWQGAAAGTLLTSGDAAELERVLRSHGAVCIAGIDEKTGKLTAPPRDLLCAAGRLADWVVAEADGARCLPVKVPAAHEPVLLDGGLVVAVAGLTALGRPLAEVCYGPERACEILHVPLDTILTPSLLARVLTSKRGQLKGVEDPDQFRVVLNQADGERLQALGRETAAAVRARLPGCRVVLTALQEEDCVKEVF